MTTSVHALVAALEQAVVQRIGEPRYRLWFAPHTRFRWQDDLLVVGVPNLHFQEWLHRTFGDAVRAAAVEVLGRPVQVTFAIEAELFQAARQQQAAARAARSDRAAPTPPPPDRPSAEDAAERDQETAAMPPRTAVSSRRRWRHLRDFIVGSCNRVAHASALSVVETPGQGPNPLVIHGPVGTGKTHLLDGIYVGLRHSHPEWHVRYVTAEEFTNRFLPAMRFGRLGGFRRHFRECDALLVDDLHFLAGKKATQEEFLHTFDVLHRDGKQLVVSCDCHPRLSDELMPDLIDRLLGGAVWGLTPPDAETRLAILRANALRGEPAVPDEVLRCLAGQLRGNVRELEGALHSVRHFSRVAGRPIDLALANEALADLLRHAVRVVQLTDIDGAICKVLRLESGALQAKQRAWAVSHPRMLAMYLARKHTAAACSEIGRYFGDRNHSTVVAAEKKVRQWLQEGGELVLGERRLRFGDVVELVERELLR